MKVLPTNYNFEIHKTIWRLRQSNSSRVALQFPEGLLMYSCIIADILSEFASVETVIMGDVTYGACCVDDYTARSLGADFMVHYETLKFNFTPETHLILVSTIQFSASLQSARETLLAHFQSAIIPQEKPLSHGEILGYLKAYRYDPYNKVFSLEKYDFEQMYTIRRGAIETAQKATKYGIVLGTLGRQGSPKILDHLEDLLKAKGKEYTIVLLSEIFPHKLDMFADVEA
eukprot:gene3568-4081_t